MKDRIHGAIKMDSLTLTSLMGETDAARVTELTGLAKFNNVLHSVCPSNFAYDAQLRIFKFEIQLGQCSMESAMITKDGEKYG